MIPPVDLSDWKPAPFALGGETVFAVGDVHGCADELRALLGRISELAADATGFRRLVYLGDLIDRGPDTLGTLRLWGEPAEARGVDAVDRVIGNHEMLMLLSLGDGPLRDKARERWLTKRAGGDKVLAEMRRAARSPEAPLSYALAREALGEHLLRQLLAQRGHRRIGNTVFVHGGLQGGSDPEAFLDVPWSLGDRARYAWITKGFLDWQGGFGGTMVVHGHTPPHKHFPLTGMRDPHLFLHDRLGLDGGSALSGIVTAAELQDGRYRILKAGTAKPDRPQPNPAGS